MDKEEIVLLLGYWIAFIGLLLLVDLFVDHILPRFPRFEHWFYGLFDYEEEQQDEP